MPGHRQNKKSRRPREETPWADPDEGIIYAVITKRSGGGFVDALCSDGIQRKVYIRNKFKKKIWLNQGDAVLVSKRTELSGDNKVDILHKYFPDEREILVSKGCLKFAGSINDTEFDSSAKEERQEYVIPSEDESEDEFQEMYEKPRRRRRNATNGLSESEESEDEEVEEVVTYDKLGNMMVNGKYATEEQIERIEASQFEESELSDSDLVSNANVRGEILAEPPVEDELDEETEQNLHTKVASEETDEEVQATQWRSGDKKKKTKTVDPMKRKKKKAFKNNRRK